LLTAGASPDISDRHGISALEHASRHGSNSVITALLTGGAKLELKKGGRQPYPLFSPLDLAAKGGHVDTLGLLVPELRRRVEVNALASDQPLTQLHRASERGRMQLVLMLLEHGADANAVDGVGLTPLHYAVKGCAVGVVEVLLERGADVDATSGLGTPFEAAVRRG
ncbi:ankyrin repeat-containing domain protein, partial [Sphaerosporella brunnea]